MALAKDYLDRPLDDLIKEKFSGKRGRGGGRGSGRGARAPVSLRRNQRRPRPIVGAPIVKVYFKTLWTL